MEAFQRIAEDMRHPPPRTLEERSTTTLKEFKGLNPTSFSGVEDPIAAKNWITMIGWIVNILAIADDLRVTLATHQLEGNTYEWWETKSLAWNHETITWERILNYFPRSLLP